MTYIRDLIEAVIPASYAEEAPVAESSDESSASDDVPENEDEGDADEDDEDEEDEDDEDEEEKDPMDVMREECADTSACKPYGHHFHECVERVTKEMEEEDYASKEHKEDCVEEFFHLQHCINDCVAPNLFFKLK